MPNAYIVDACRTPRGIGKVGKGALAHLHPSYLGSTVLKALAERNALNTAEVDCSQCLEPVLLIERMAEDRSPTGGTLIDFIAHRGHLTMLLR